MVAHVEYRSGFKTPKALCVDDMGTSHALGRCWHQDRFIDIVVELCAGSEAQSTRSLKGI